MQRNDAFGNGPEGQIPCYVTYTNEEVHEILRTGFEKSSILGQYLGPRP